MDAFKSLTANIHKRTYRFAQDPAAEASLAALMDDVTHGHVDPAGMNVQSPGWVAARLWETISTRTSSPAAALRQWVDFWGLLQSPRIVPSLVWSQEDASAFKAAALERIASDPALGDWNATLDLYAKQAAAAHDLAVADAAWRFPEPRATLVGRALWCELGTAEHCIYGSLEAGSDLFGLARLLLADAEQEDYAPAPHPTVAAVLDLAIDRAELFISPPLPRPPPTQIAGGPPCGPAKRRAGLPPDRAVAADRRRLGPRARPA